MENRKQKAVRLFREGYNCSQAVFCAYSDIYGIEEQMALKLSSSFGGGMGRMREVCGAVSGMFLLAGLETGTADSRDVEGKKKNYEMVQKLAEEYRKTNGSIICRELLGVKKGENEGTTPEKRTKEYYKKRPCADLIENAAEIIERILLEDKADGSEI